MEYFFYISLFVGLIFFLFRKDIINQRKKRERERESERKKEMEEKIEEERQEKIKKEIDDLADSIINDWNKSLYADKIETPGYKTVIYKFENGDIVFYQGETLRYTTSRYKAEYTIGLFYRTKFTKIFNRMVEIINEGNTSTRKSKSSSYSYSHSSSNGGKTSSKTTSSDPRARRHEILMETIKLRKENLQKMSKNDPQRPALEFELKVAEKKAAEIKNR